MTEEKKEKKKKKIPKWVVAASTVISLTMGGYKLGEFNNEKGYAVIDTLTKEIVITEKDTFVIMDTVWFKDSTNLAEFAVLGKARLGGVKLGGKKKGGVKLGGKDE